MEYISSTKVGPSAYARADFLCYNTEQMIPYTKPFLTLDKQITLLASRGLAIPDTAFAKDCLMNIGYYRLSGYWYPMRESKTVKKPKASYQKA